MTQKRIIIYSTNDKYITLPLLEKIFSNSFKKEKIDLYLNQPKFLHKIKILIVFALFSPFKDFKILFQSKKSVNLKQFDNVQVIKKLKSNYNYGFSINYTNKIKLGKFDIFNFHLGNFTNQRGSFGYFYKFKYNWKYMDLTFHLIDKNWDKGKILKRRKIYVKKMSAIEICTLYKKNYDFIIQNVEYILNKKLSYKKTRYGILNITPTYFDIIKTFLLKKFF